MHNAARCRAKSNLYTVVVRNSCTNVPLAADKAQKDGTILAKRHFKPSHTSVRPPGSSGVLRSAAARSGCLHHYPFDDDNRIDVFPQCDEQLTGKRNNRRFLEPPATGA